jgi:Uma2 family endonuclease
MATVNSAVYVPLEVYLETTYRPDRDWIDGEVKERNMGERPHASIQKFLVRFLGNNEQAWKIVVLPEQRVQTSSKNYRIADVCVVSSDAPDEAIVRTPPLLCIEILSRDDRMSDMQERVDDYLAMGVAVVWVIDPHRRLAFSAISRKMTEAAVNLTVPGTPVHVSVAEMFAVLG